MFPQLDEKLAKETQLSIGTSGESHEKSRVSRPTYYAIGLITSVVLLTLAPHLVVTYKTIRRHYGHTEFNTSYEDSDEHQVDERCTYENYFSRTDYQLLNPQERYTLEYDKVACWQNEGVWIAQLSPVELAHLGIDRFHDTPKSAPFKQTEEDLFCSRLRTLGASFWSLPTRWPLWCEDLAYCADSIIEYKYEIGFPSNGGVWVGNTHEMSVKDLFLWAKMDAALTMDERCGVIRSLGGKFCESLEACDKTKDFLRTTTELLEEIDSRQVGEW
jgi:hypothetical protein